MMIIDDDHLPVCLYQGSEVLCSAASSGGTSDAVKQMPERQSTLRASRSRQSTARRELRRLLQHSAFAIDISQELLANSGGVQLAGASMYRRSNGLS